LNGMNISYIPCLMFKICNLIKSLFS
jgi:hypothetical protein